MHAATYNNRLQTSEIKLGTAGAPTSILSLVYNYGTTTNNGNIQSISYTGGGLSNTQSFSYDSLNRLATAQENAGASWSQTNGYDRYANRWIALPGGAQSIYCNTSNNRITGWSYDASGNLLSDGVTNYTYDAEGHIKMVNGTTAYKYDGACHRQKRADARCGRCYWNRKTGRRSEELHRFARHVGAPEVLRCLQERDEDASPTEQAGHC